MRVGLTGGIGSGKSYVAAIFELLGACVYRSDDRAKELMVTDSGLIAEIKSSFGDDSYCEDGSLNREYLAAQIFSCSEARERLNGLVHPAVARDFICYAEENSDKLVIIESAILFESGFNRFVDSVVAVTADIECRVARVVRRDGVGDDIVRRRIAAQMSDNERNELSDFLIINSDRELLLPQVVEVYNKCK